MGKCEAEKAFELLSKTIFVVAGIGAVVLFMLYNEGSKPTDGYTESERRQHDAMKTLRNKAEQERKRQDYLDGK